MPDVPDIPVTGVVAVDDVNPGRQEQLKSPALSIEQLSGASVPKMNPLGSSIIISMSTKASETGDPSNKIWVAEPSVSKPSS